MGELINDLLMIIGILPMPISERIELNKRITPGHVGYLYLDEFPIPDRETRNFFDLLNWNGLDVFVNDRTGYYHGILSYKAFDKNYSLNTFEGIVKLKVEDLEKVVPKGPLN